MNFKKIKAEFENELFNNVIPFWSKNGLDEENGGMRTCLNRKGRVFSSDKSVWMQGRTAWTYSNLCNTFGVKEEWLKIAKSCLDFIEKHCIDTDKRLYFTVKEDGTPLRKRRYLFSEAFYIIACAEYYKATKDEKYLKIAREYYDFANAIIDNGELDPYKITPKVIKGARDGRSMGVPMIFLNVAFIMKECDTERSEIYDKRCEKFVNDIINYHFKPELGDISLENVGLNGEVLTDVASFRVVNPGHSIEMSWFLLDYAKQSGKTELIELAERVFNSAFNIGWDKKYGGILYFTDYAGEPVEAYEHDMKLWWPHNEAVIATLKLYEATKNNKYLKIFKKVYNYAKKHFLDKDYGEWYGYLRRDGKPTEPACKGQIYKGPFHVPRMYITASQTLKNLIGE
jgi:N-acylglucosamine 2-epimerase